MRTLLLALLALPAAAEGEAVLQWKFAAGDAFEITVHTERDSGMTTAKGTLDTSFELDIAAVLTVVSVGEDGVAQCELAFKGVTGTVAALNIRQPLKLDQAALQEKKVPAKLTPRGALTLDEALLRAACDKTDLNDDLKNLFPILPEGPVAKGAKWSSDVERHRDEATLDEVREAEGRRTALLSVTSSADQKADTGSDLKTELKVSGAATASFDVGEGRLKWSEQELNEDAVLETKDSKLETRSRLKRKVGVVKVPR